MSYSSEVLADSPIVYWRLGEASGTTTMVDSSGNGHDETYSTGVTLGAPSLLTSTPTTAATFLAADTFSAWASWQNAASITVEAWIKTSASGIRAILDRDTLTTANRAWQFRLNAGKLEFVRVGNAAGSLSAVTATSPGTVNNGAAHHVVATYDGTSIRLYIDGALVTTTTASGGVRQPTTSTKFGIGVSHAVGGSGVTAQFDGVIDEAAYYGTALSGARILAHYNAGVASASAVELTLAGTTQRRTGAFALASTASLALAGSTQRRVGSFLFGSGRSTVLAGVTQRREAEFSMITTAALNLAGSTQRRVGAFEVAVVPGLVLAGQTQRRVATFTAVTHPPIVPAPPSAGAESRIVAQAFGPVTMDGTQPVYEISEAAIPRARARYLVDGVDVTYFRATEQNPSPTSVSYTLLEPLLYGPGTLDLPQVAACFERLGVGALSWLRPGAPVEVQRVFDAYIEGGEAVVVDTDYKGFIVAFDTSGRTLSVELGGEANGRAALRDRQVPIFPRVNDIGQQIATAVLALGLPFEPRLGPDTGIEVMTTGGVGHLDHIQTLVAKAWTRAGRQWTVMPDPVTGVYELHRKDDNHIHGTVFVDPTRTVPNLRRDIAEEPNRIFATGVTPAGQRVRFGVYPGLVQGKTPPFPGHMEFGDTGPGVRLLILKLQAMGYLKLEDTGGGYDADVAAAVTELQVDAGLYDDGFSTPAVPGEVGVATWNALYDIDVTGLSAETAHIEPAAQRSKVRQWNRSASGQIMRANPNYEPDKVVVDRSIDLGAAGMNRPQMRESSRTELHDSNDPNWVGTIVFNTGALIRGDGFTGMDVGAEDVMDARAIRPGMNLDLPQFDGGTFVHVAACEVDAAGIVTATVDTRFRDAMEVWEIMLRNAESRRDPARSRQRKHRASTITKDSIGEWDEIGGLLGNDIELDPGWNVFPVVAAMEGTIARIKIDTTPATEFVLAVFGERIGAGALTSLIGDPLTKAGTKKWSKESVRQDLERDYELLYVAGDNKQPCGYWPKQKGKEGDGEGEATLTGKWNDDAGFAYRSRVRHMLWVAVWSAEASKIQAGRIMWPQLEAGV